MTSSISHIRCDGAEDCTFGSPAPARSTGSRDRATVVVRTIEAVFRKGRYLFGFTTSFRMGQLIRYSLALPKPTGNLDSFMATAFVDAVRDCLKAGGWAGFAAVGCGDQIALGALFATAGTGLGPRRRVRTALAAAERFSTGVRGPFGCLKG